MQCTPRRHARNMCHGRRQSTIRSQLLRTYRGHTLNTWHFPTQRNYPPRIASKLQRLQPRPSPLHMVMRSSCHHSCDPPGKVRILGPLLHWVLRSAAAWRCKLRRSCKRPAPKCLAIVSHRRTQCSLIAPQRSSDPSGMTSSSDCAPKAWFAQLRDTDQQHTRNNHRECFQHTLSVAHQQGNYNRTACTRLCPHHFGTCEHCTVCSSLRLLHPEIGRCYTAHSRHHPLLP